MASMHLLRSRYALIGGAVALAVVVTAAIIFVAPDRPVAVASPTIQPTASPVPTPRPTPTPTPSPKPPEVAAEPVCPLNGLPLYNRKVLKRPALAVQIDAHPEARPTRNLTRADMVVEATVEGDVTRFTGIYLCRKTVGLTGPVRSGRYYVIDLWHDLHVLPFFFGSSSEAVARYKAAHLPFVNGISGSWPWFRRACCHAAPHNLYGEIDAVRRAFGHDQRLDERADRVRALRPPFPFRDDADVPGGRHVRSIEIYTNSYWHFGWRWVGHGLGWQRIDGGAPAKDGATGQRIRATTVLVQRVKEEIIYNDPDPAGNPRRLQHLVGRGYGTLYVHGRGIPVRWSRYGPRARTVWRYMRSGDRVVLPPGVVWWEIVPQFGRVHQS
jgi:hypothetical protein